MEVLKIINKISFIEDIKQLGGEIYLVGGCVRDYYLGKVSKDIDLVITLIDNETIITVLKQYGKVDIVGESFGVIKFKPFGWEGEPIDIAQPRVDVLEDKTKGHQGIKALFNPNISIEDDLLRRDFTINSIAIKLDGTIIDPYNGLKDIKDKIIRATSNQSFNEDPLRMLRAIQFASRFDFQIESNTWNNIKNNSSDIKTISGERILEELNKIFYKGDINYGLSLLESSGIYQEIFNNSNIIKREEYTIEDFYFVICGSEKYKNILKGDNNIYKGIQALEKIFEYSSEMKKSDVRKLIFDSIQLSPTILNTKIVCHNLVNEVIQEYKNSTLPKKITDLAINGEDLTKQGFKGKEIGERQKFLLMEIFKDNVKNIKEDLLIYEKN